jgi:hypothetical protein
MFSARSPKNIKISTFEKPSKSSSFRPDDQRQILLDLLRSYRYKMRLISLIRSQTFFEIMWSDRCEYSKCMWWASWSKRSVEITWGGCRDNQRGVNLFAFFKYTNLFINKTFNNFLWRSVIYDSNCNDSFIYDLN